MSFPSDYYKDKHSDPHYHTHGDACYVEPDFMANDHDDQLPMISAIGRGPRGRGVTAIVTEDNNDEFTFEIVDDITGEAIFTSPNLSPGRVWITQPDHDPVPGEVTHATVHIKRGKDVQEYDLDINPGAHGSLFYMLEREQARSYRDIYQCEVDELIVYGRQNWPNKPMPRPNDIVCFFIKEDDYRALCFGTIHAVENGSVVFTSQMAIDISLPSVGDDGHWYVDGNDTGISAVGPKGDKGEKGDTGPQGKTGPKGDKGEKGSKGDTGKDGKDALIEIGTVSTLPPTSAASVSKSHDDKTNVTTLNFGIPEGAAGKAINIRGGIWRTSYLPEFQDTPVNDAFIVYDDDKQFDLYVRGSMAVQAEDGGPWTVVENWQGRPGSSVRYMNPPNVMETEVGGTIEVSTAEAESVFQYHDYLADDDLVIDENGTVGIISSAEDNNGVYTITTVGIMNKQEIDLVSTENDGIVSKMPANKGNGGYNLVLTNTSESGWNTLSSLVERDIPQGFAHGPGFVVDYGQNFSVASLNDLTFKGSAPGLMYAGSGTSSPGNDYFNINDGRYWSVMDGTGTWRHIAATMFKGTTDGPRFIYPPGSAGDESYILQLYKGSTGYINLYRVPVNNAILGASGNYGPSLVPYPSSVNKANQVLYGDGTWKEISVSSDGEYSNYVIYESTSQSNTYISTNSNRKLNRLKTNELVLIKWLARPNLSSTFTYIYDSSNSNQKYNIYDTDGNSLDLHKIPITQKSISIFTMATGTEGQRLVYQGTLSSSMTIATKSDINAAYTEYIEPKLTIKAKAI